MFSLSSVDTYAVDICGFSPPPQRSGWLHAGRIAESRPSTSMVMKYCAPAGIWSSTQPTSRSCTSRPVISTLPAEGALRQPHGLADWSAAHVTALATMVRTLGS